MQQSAKYSPNSFLILLIGIGFVGPIAALLALPWYADISYWIGLAVLFACGITAHFFAVRKRYPALLHVAIGIALLQLVFMAWLAHYVVGWHLSDIGANLPNYLTYSVPFTIALALGMLTATTGLNAEISPAIEKSQSADLSRWCHYLIFGGITILLIGQFIYIPALAFVFHLLANLRFVGGLGLMLLGNKSWKSRTALLFILEIYFSTGSAMFHSLALWGAIYLAFWIFCIRPRFLTVCLALIISGVGIVALEHTKLKVRTDVRDRQTEHIGGGNYSPYPVIDVIAPWGIYMLEGSADLLSGQLDEEFKRHLTHRYNQGWIVNEVMLHVPSVEPYAEGETILRAFVAAFLPRFIAPDKYRAGGQDYMQRFAGYELQPGTSMNIGISGEFYANFGKRGAILAAILHGLLVGLVFRGFAILARRHRLFWAFAPFVLFWALKSEEGFGEVLNWMSKAGMISIALILAVPTFRTALLIPIIRSIKQDKTTPTPDSEPEALPHG